MAASIDQMFNDTIRSLGLAEPQHSHDPESPLTKTLNVARRNGSPYQPRRCACLNCRYNFGHVAEVIV